MKSTAYCSRDSPLKSQVPVRVFRAGLAFSCTITKPRNEVGTMMKEKLSERFELDLSHLEKEQIEKTAAYFNMSRSQLVREYALNPDKFEILEEGAALAESYDRLWHKLFQCHKTRLVQDEDAEELRQELHQNHLVLCELKKTLYHRSEQAEPVPYIRISGTMSDSAARTESIELRLTPNQKEWLTKTAKGLELHTSEFVRVQLFCSQKLVVLSKQSSIAANFIRLYTLLESFYRQGFFSQEMEYPVMQLLDKNMLAMDAVTDRLTVIHRDQ